MPMIKTLRNIFKQDKEKFVVPKGVQDVIPVTAIYDDGVFRVAAVLVREHRSKTGRRHGEADERQSKRESRAQLCF